LPSLFSEALILSINWNTLTLLIDVKHFVRVGGKKRLVRKFQFRYMVYFLPWFWWFTLVYKLA